MGPVSVSDSLLQKRRGDDPKVFAMTLNLHENQEPSAVRSKEAPSGLMNITEATELSVLPTNTTLDVADTPGACAQEKGDPAPNGEHPISAISQPIPPPQKSNDEMEPPTTPKRKVSFAPDLFPPEEAINGKSDQSVLREGTTPLRTPPQLGGSSSMSTTQEVERILQVRIRGPLIVMVTLLLLVVLLLVTISGTMIYFLLSLRNEIMNRKISSLPAPA